MNMQQLIDDQNRTIPNVGCPNGYNEKIVGTGTTSPSGVINADKDTWVRITTSADAYYEVAETPAATTSSNPLYAKTGEEIKVPKGEKIAVLVTGDFHIREKT